MTIRGISIRGIQDLRCLVAAVLTVILWAHANPLLAQKAPAAQGFESFKMVRTRNIFDPDRRPPTSQNGSVVSTVPIAQSDYVALTGTLVTADKALAFFSGSRGDFDKVLPVKEAIAGSTITKISPGSVTIERAGKASVVPVGWTLPLNGAASAPAPVAASESDALSAFPAPAAVAPAAATAAAAAPTPATATPRTGTTPSGTPASAATPNPDVARMMRERRQRESQ